MGRDKRQRRAAAKAAKAAAKSAGEVKTAAPAPGSHELAAAAAFINPLAGGQRGAAAKGRLCELLGAERVHDLVPSEGGPRPGLEAMAKEWYAHAAPAEKQTTKATDGARRPASVVLCCGGDGTFNWVSTVLLELELEAPAGAAPFRPDLVPVPLGTGNDLSRALGWGGAYPGEQGLGGVVAAAREAPRGASLDLWAVHFDTARPKFPQMENYFSVGVDALAAKRFADLREANPEQFKSQTKNKAVYASEGAKLAVSGAATLNYKVKQLLVGGEACELPEGTKSIVVLNIPSFGSGTDPWGKGTHLRRRKDFAPPAVNDGLLEVVALRSVADVPKLMALGAATAGRISAARVGQGSSVRIVFEGAEAAQEEHPTCCGLWKKKSARTTLAAQVDGEAWYVVTSASCQNLFCANKSNPTPKDTRPPLSQFFLSADLALEPGLLCPLLREFPFASEVIDITLKGRVGVRFGPEHAAGEGISAGQVDGSKGAPELGWVPESAASKRADAEANAASSTSSVSAA